MQRKIKNGYDEFYQSKFTCNDDWTEASIFWHPRRWIATLAKKEKGSCLVIGCGIIDLQILYSHKKELIGIDISRVPLTRVKKFGQVILADGTMLPFCNSVVNTVCAFDVLEHVPNKIALMIEANRVLRNEGKIFLSVPIKTKDMKEDDRQPFDEPPTLNFLLKIVKRNFACRL
ncbi:MAG: class I SAM-dependent methyltransferase [Candidatus Jordarchaeaceae archaeon]